MDLLQTEIASVAQVRNSHSLRNRPFDSSALVVAALPVQRPLLGTRSHQSLISGLISHLSPHLDTKRGTAPGNPICLGIASIYQVFCWQEARSSRICSIDCMYVRYNLKCSGRLVNNWHYVYSALDSSARLSKRRARLYIIMDTPGSADSMI